MRSLDFKGRPYSLLSASERSSTTKVGDLRRGHYIAKAGGASRMYREVILKIKRCIQSYFFSLSSTLADLYPRPNGWTRTLRSIRMRRLMHIPPAPYNSSPLSNLPNVFTPAKTTEEIPSLTRKRQGSKMDRPKAKVKARKKML
jgi:hypothetical protein